MKKKSNWSSLLLVANYPSDVGYAWWLIESFWVTLAQYYHGKHLILLAYPEINQLPTDISKAPLVTVQQDFGGTSLGDLAKQCRFIRRHAVRAIYFSDRSTWSWIYLLYRLCGVRLIITHDHTPGLRTVPRGLKAWLKCLMHRLPLLTVDGAIGATEFVRKRLIDVVRLPPQKCFAAPNGLPQGGETITSVDLHSVFDIPANRKIMIMTGRAHRYKGVIFILEAMANLEADTRNKLHFVFVGDGPDLEFFKQRACELALSKHCSFLGRRSDIPKILRGGDFAIHASSGEVGYSLSILEYMQAGLPVIVSNNPSVCGATKDKTTGLFYQEHDLNDATKAIQRLVEDDDFRRKLGSQAKVSAADFTLSRTHQSLMEAIKSIDRKMILVQPAKF